MTDQYIYAATLPIDTETYVEREADEELYQGLRQGNFCYVFNSRKTGKSSLRVRVVNRLKQAGFACAEIDVSDKQTKFTTLERWYNSILLNLSRQLALNINLKTWLNDYNWLSPLDRFGEFIESSLLPQVNQRVIIFIDEVDSLLSLEFPTDDLFAYIRACHNKAQSGEINYQRLTFCLLGTATPSDLIQDKRRTPFNIGQAIELKPFTRQQANKLAKGFEGKVDNPSQVLCEILDWTGGQPFLTQKLCQLVLNKTAETRSPQVNDLVRKHILEDWETKDHPEHLKTIRNRLVSEEDEKIQSRTSRLLGIYQQILTSPTGTIAADNSPDQMELQLSGLVVKENGHLRVYNPIYQQIFNREWVQQELAKLRPYQEDFAAWFATNCTDDSRLLRGQKLEDALQWKAGKRLSDDDLKFLDASQAYEREELRKAQEKARKIIELAQKGTQIERAGVQALRVFNSKLKLKALQDAIKAGQELQELLTEWKDCVQDEPTLLKTTPAASPHLALQSILARIRERRQLQGHSGWVTSVSFSPDGQRLATASADRTAKLWDLQGQELVTFSGHSNSVWSVSFSPDGQRLATASEDGTAKLWDLQGQELVTFSGHSNSVWSVSFSPDGQWLATASGDGTAKLWDFKGQELVTFSGHSHSVWSVSFNPDGQRLATASDDGTAKLWDLRGQELVTFSGHSGWVMSVSFSPDGQRLVTGSSDGTAKVWDLQGQELVTFSGHSSWVMSVSFSPDGQRVATGSEDGTAKMWDLQGNLLADFTGSKGYLLEEADFIELNSAIDSVCFSPDGKFLTVAYRDRKVRLWPVESLDELLERARKWVQGG
ncbi:MAG: AAA-like domain-containing protein [Actinomycetota bacterium]